MSTQTQREHGEKKEEEDCHIWFYVCLDLFFVLWVCWVGEGEVICSLSSFSLHSFLFFFFRIDSFPFSGLTIPQSNMSEHQRELWQLLPKEYGYVILSIVGIFFVNIFQIILVPFLFWIWHLPHPRRLLILVPCDIFGRLWELATSTMWRRQLCMLTRNTRMPSFITAFSVHTSRLWRLCLWFSLPCSSLGWCIRWGQKGFGPTFFLLSSSFFFFLLLSSSFSFSFFFLFLFSFFSFFN